MLLGSVGTEIACLLAEVNTSARFPLSLVCDDAGLLVAAAGEGADEEQLAGLASLFDDIVVRAHRDVGLTEIDEVSMFDRVWGRCVVRPLLPPPAGRFFLVVQVAPRGTWRRYSNKLKREIARIFDRAHADQEAL